MSCAICGVVGAGVAIAGGVASSVISNSAQQSAVAAQENAVNGMRGLNIDELNNMASTQDIAKYQQDFQEEAKVDPEFASLRSQGAASVLGALGDLNNPNSPQQLALNAMQKSVMANNKPSQDVIQSLLTQAKADLDAGATLPPSFQAEMVRSGLASGGAAGTGVAGEGATGVAARTLLGTAGLNLQMTRQGQAASMTGAALTAEQQQQQALSELSNLSQSITLAKANLGGAAATMGTNAVPNIGLSGSEDVNMSIGNTNLANNKKLALGNLAAQSSLATGQMWSGIVGSVAGGLSSGLGGTSGSGGGTSGSGGGWLSGLLGSGGTPSAATNVAVAQSIGAGLQLGP